MGGLAAAVTACRRHPRCRRSPDHFGLCRVGDAGERITPDGRYIPAQPYGFSFAPWRLHNLAAWVGDPARAFIYESAMVAVADVVRNIDKGWKPDEGRPFYMVWRKLVDSLRAFDQEA